MRDLYARCTIILLGQTGCENYTDSNDAELIIESAGMRISADRGLTDENASIGQIMEAFPESAGIRWKENKRK